MKTPAPLPEDAELDRAMLAKARDFRARAHARLLKATTPEEKVSAEKSVKVGEAFVAKMLMAPRRARDRDNKLAAELAALWRPMRQLVETVEAQAREMQQLQAAVSACTAAIEADRPARDEVNAAIGQFYKDPQGAALATLARHRSEDAAKEKRNLDRASASWEAKRQKLEADIARKQKILDRFNHDRDIEPDDIRHQALTRHITKILAEKIQAMDALSTLLDERPH